MKLFIPILALWISNAIDVNTQTATLADLCNDMPLSLRLTLNYDIKECLLAGYCWDERRGICYREKATQSCDIPLSDRIPCGPEHPPQTMLGKDMCERHGCCWDPKVDARHIDLHCFTKKLTNDDPCDFENRTRCDARSSDGYSKSIGEEEACVDYGCCWDKTKGWCYEEDVYDPCDYDNKKDCWSTTTRKEAAYDISITDEIQCVRFFNCCWEPRSRWCYRKDGCWNWPDRYGPCSKTCGIGLWSHHTACGKFVGWEKCCVMPCPQPTGPPAQVTPTTGPPREPCSRYPPYGG